MSFTNKDIQVVGSTKGGNISYILLTKDNHILRVIKSPGHDEDLKSFRLIYNEITAHGIDAVGTATDSVDNDHLEYLLHERLNIRFTLDQFKRLQRNKELNPEEEKVIFKSLLDFVASTYPYVFISDLHTENIVFLDTGKWTALDMGTSHTGYITYKGLLFQHFRLSREQLEQINSVLSDCSMNQCFEQLRLDKKPYLAATKNIFTDFD